MNLRRVVIGAVVLSALVAGNPVSSTQAIAPWIEEGPGHDHRTPSHHDISWNMVQTDWNPLGGTVAHMAGAHALEVRNGYLFVAAYSDQYGASGGVYVFDVATDPSKPALLGKTPGYGPMGGDRSLDATVDGNFVLLGTEALPAAYTKTGIVNPFPSGIVLIDARNKELPVYADFEPSLGVHSVIVQRIGGVDYVFTSDLSDIPASAYRIDLDPVPHLTPIGAVAIWHDGSTSYDPASGKTYLFTADGDATGGDRVRVYDVSNPAAEVIVGNWMYPRPDLYYAHSTISTTIEGKRILVTSSENEGTDPTPIWFLDASNLTNIQAISTWTNPANVGGSAGLAFSLHNPRIFDGKLYYAHYHAGVVVFDVGSLAKLQDPPILGYFVPHEDTGYRHVLDPVQQAAGMNSIHYPRVYDVAVNPVSGHIYAADIFMGLYTLELQS